MKQTVEDNARKGMAIGVSNKQDDDSGSKETGACLRATKLQHHVARSLVEGADKDSSCQVPSTNGQTPIAMPITYLLFLQLSNSCITHLTVHSDFRTSSIVGCPSG